MIDLQSGSQQQLTLVLAHFRHANSICSSLFLLVDKNRFWQRLKIFSCFIKFHKGKWRAYTAFIPSNLWNLFYHKAFGEWAFVPTEARSGCCDDKQQTERSLFVKTMRESIRTTRWLPIYMYKKYIPIK